ncbi:protein localization [Balamuthia mandrillaris]
MANIGPQLDWTRLEPLPQNKVVAYVNHFIIRTTEFLNRFSYLCEQKLSAVSSDIQRLEVTMALLEAKLNSIPELEGLSVSSTSSTAETTSPSTDYPPTTDGIPPPPPVPGSVPPVRAPDLPSPEDDQYQDHTSRPPPEARQEGGGGLKMKDDPRYSTYFTMMRLKVPASAIKQKMMLEGINPDILDNPEAPSDFVGELPNSGSAEAEAPPPPLPVGMSPAIAAVANVPDFDDSASSSEDDDGEWY